jgi:hypothetical protein
VTWARSVQRATLLICLALAGCPDKSQGVVLVKNVCVTDLDCLERDASLDAARAECDEVTLQCVREEVDEDYPLVLQVRPNNNDSRLKLVEQYTYEAFTLEGSRNDHTLEVPAAVPISGTVSWRDADTLLESEVTFVPRPRDFGSPVTSKVVTTPRRGPAPNLQVSLIPETDYQVRVQPLLEQSAELPPISELHLGGDLKISISYADMELEHRSGRLVDEFGRPFAQHRIRLEDKGTAEVLSSTAETDAQGNFDLYALPSVMAGKGFNVVVSLQSFPLWRVKVAIDGSKLVQDASLVLPRVPTPIEFAGSLVAREPVKSSKLPAAPNADIIFVSSFPVPTESGDPRDADWCRWQRGSSDGSNPPRCSARIATTADAQGKYSVQLLPGVYDAFVVPGSQSLTAPVPLRTTRNVVKVLSQDSPQPQQSGQTLYLDRATQFKGRLVSFRGEPMPNVTVSARSLVPREGRPNSDLYEYARSAVAVTNDQGGFFLNSDLGYFDFSVEPAKESGFAWVQTLNREVDQELVDGGAPVASDAEVNRLSELVARAPVIVAGRVMHEDTPLPGALVEAFALVVSVTKEGGRRSVRVAQALSDADGYYRLALPLSVRAEEPEAEAGVDVARQPEADAGAQETYSE